MKGSSGAFLNFRVQNCCLYGVDIRALSNEEGNPAKSQVSSVSEQQMFSEGVIGKLKSGPCQTT